MSWEFAKAKFKVGERVCFPYGRKVGTIKAIEAQVTDDATGRHKNFLGFLYKITWYTVVEEQLTKIRRTK